MALSLQIQNINLDNAIKSRKNKKIKIDGKRKPAGKQYEKPDEKRNSRILCTSHSK